MAEKIEVTYSKNAATNQNSAYSQWKAQKPGSATQKQLGTSPVTVPYNPSAGVSPESAYSQWKQKRMTREEVISQPKRANPSMVQYWLDNTHRAITEAEKLYTDNHGTGLTSDMTKKSRAKLEKYAADADLVEDYIRNNRDRYEDPDSLLSGVAEYRKAITGMQDAFAAARPYSDYTREELDLATQTKQREYDAFREKWGESVLSSLNDIRNAQDQLTSAGADQSHVDSVEQQKKQLAAQTGLDRETLDRISYDAVQLEQSLNQLRYQQEVMAGYEVVQTLDKDVQEALRAVVTSSGAGGRTKSYLRKVDALKALTGWDGAKINEMREATSYYYNAKNAEQKRAEAAAKAEKNPGLATAGSILSQPFAGLGGTIDLALQGLTKGDKPIDINTQQQIAGQMNTATRGQVSTDIAEGNTTMALGFIPNPTNAEDRADTTLKVNYEGADMPDWMGGQNWGSFIYQAGTSALDSAYVAAIGGVLGKAVGAAGVPVTAQNTIRNATVNLFMGSSAARDTAVSLIEQGVADDKAVAAGLLSGAIEGLTEAVGVDNVFKAWTADSAKWWKKMAASVVSEGGEEWMSNVLNRAVVEPIYNGGLSSFKTAYYQNIDAGLSEKDALREAALSIVGDDISAILSGFVSSVPMSGVAAHFNRQADKQQAEAAKKVSPVEAKYNEVSAANPDKSVMRPIATELTEAGYTDAKKAVKQGEILEKVFSGEDITDAELDALDLNNEAVRTVFANRSGLTGMKDVADFTRELKRTYVAEAVKNVRALKATQDAASTASQQVLEKEKERQRNLNKILKKRAANENRRAEEAAAALQERVKVIENEQAEAEAKAAAPVTPYEHNRSEAPPLGDKKAPVTPKRQLPDMQGRSLENIEATIGNITGISVPSVRAFVAQYFDKRAEAPTRDELILALSAYQELMEVRGFTTEEADAIINAYAESLTAGAGGDTLDANNTKEATNGREDGADSGSSAGERGNRASDSERDRGVERERLESTGLGRGDRLGEVDRGRDAGRRLISSKALGLPNGTDTENLYELNTEDIQERPDLQKILTRAARYRGTVKIRFLTGGAIYVSDVADGKYVRAAYNPAAKEILVLIDADEAPGKLVAHELIHHFMQLTGYSRGRSRLREEIKARVASSPREAKIIADALTAYHEAYRKSYGSKRNKYIDEIIADAYAGLNPYGVEGMEELTSLVREVVNTDKVQGWLVESAGTDYSLADVPDTWGRTLEELTSARDEGTVRERLKDAPKAKTTQGGTMTPEEREARAAAQTADEEASAAAADRIQQLLTLVRSMSPEEQEAAIQRFKAANAAEKSALTPEDAARDERMAEAAAEREAENARWAEYEARHRREEVVEVLTEEEKLARREEYARRRQEAHEQREALLQQERESKIAELRNQEVPLKEELAKLNNAKEAEDVPYNESPIQQARVDVTRQLAENYMTLAAYTGDGEYYHKAREQYEALAAMLRGARNSLSDSYSEQKGTMYRETDIEDDDQMERDTESIDEDIYADRENYEPNALAAWKKELADEERRVKELINGELRNRIMAASDKAIQEEVNEQPAPDAEKGKSLRWTKGVTLDGAAEMIWRNAYKKLKGGWKNAPYAQKVWAYLRAFGSPEFYNERTKKKDGVFEVAKTIIKTESVAKVPPERLALVLANAESLTGDGVKLYNPRQKASYKHSPRQILEAAMDDYWFNSNGVADVGSVTCADFFSKKEYKGARHHITNAYRDKAKETHNKLVEIEQRKQAEHKEAMKAADADVKNQIGDELYSAEQEQDNWSIDNYRKVARDAKLDAEDIARRIRVPVTNRKAESQEELDLKRDVSRNPEKYIQVYPVFEAPNGLDWFKQRSSKTSKKMSDIAREVEGDDQQITDEADITAAGLSIHDTVSGARSVGVTGIDADTAGEIDLYEVNQTVSSQASDDVTLAATDYEDYKNAVHELTDIFTALDVAGAQLFIEPGKSPISAKEALDLLFKDSRGRPISFANADVSLMDTVASILRTELNNTADEKTPHISLLETVVLAHELLGRDTPAWLSAAAAGEPIAPVRISDDYETEDAPDINANATALKDVVGVEYKVLKPGQGNRLSNRASEGTQKKAQTDMQQKYGSFDASVLNTQLGQGNAAVRKLQELGHRVLDANGVTDVGIMLQNAEKGAKTRGISDAALAYAIHEATLDKKNGAQVNLETLLNNAAVLNELFSTDGVTETTIKSLRKLGYRVLDNSGLTGAYRSLKVIAPDAARFNIPGKSLAEAIDIKARAAKEGIRTTRAELLEYAAKLAEADAAMQEDIARDAAREQQEAREWAKQHKAKPAKREVPAWMEDDGSLSYSITASGEVVSDDDFDFDQFLAYADKNPDIIPDKNRAPTSVNKPVSHADPTYMDELDRIYKEEKKQVIEAAMQDAKAESTTLTPELLANLSPAMQALYYRFDSLFGDGSFASTFRTVEQAEHQLERENEKKANTKVSSPSDVVSMAEEAQKRVAQKKRDAQMRKLVKKETVKATAAEDMARWQLTAKATNAVGGETETEDAADAALTALINSQYDLAYIRGLQESQEARSREDFEAQLREQRKRVMQENSEAAHRGRKSAWRWEKARDQEKAPAQRKTKFAEPLTETIAGKAKEIADTAYRMVASATAAIEWISRRQTRLDTADTYVTMVKNSQHTATYFMTDALLDRTGGKILGPSGVSVLTCLDKNGNVEEEKNAVYQRYLILKHTVDRMSIEANARKAVLDFEKKYPYLVNYTKDNDGRREFGQMLTQGDEKAWQYKRLIDAALKAKNAPVLSVETESGGLRAMTAEEAKATAESIERENPWVAAKAAEWYAWYDTFMREHVVGGSLTMDNYEAMHKLYPHYVPTHRVFETGKKGVGSVAFTGGTTTSDTKSVRKATGSLRDVRDVYDSVADLLARYVKQDRNRMLKANILLEAAFDADGNFADYIQFDWVSGVQTDIIMGDGDYLDLVSAMEENERIDYAESRDLALQEDSEFVRDPDKPYKMTTWINGKKYSAYVNRSLFEGLQSLTNAPRDPAVEAVRKASRIFNAPHKALVTSLSPLFAVTNIARDLPSAAVYSVAGLRFGKFIPQAFREMTQNSDNWQSFQALGGTRNGYYWSESGFLAEYNKSRSAPAKVKGAASFLGEHSEAITRFAEYLAGLEKYGNTPKGRIAALKRSAEVTVDFSRGGTLSKIINDFVPFFNPAIQGLDKMIRSVVMAPEANAALKQVAAQAGKTLGRAVVVHTLVDAMLWALRSAFDRDEDWDELSDYVKNNYYCVPILGEKGRFLKIPKNREWSALLGTPVVMLLEAATGEDDAFDSYIETALKANVGLPNVLMGDTFSSALFSLRTNEDYKGSAIVPYEFAESDLELQMDKDTSWAAVLIGKVFKGKLSPMQADYLLHSYFGSFASTILFDCAPWGLVTEDDTVAPFGEFVKVFTNMSAGVADEVQNKFIADNRYSNYYIGKYYDTKEELDTAGKNFGVITGGTPGETEGYLRTALGRDNEYVQRVHELNNQITAARETGDDTTVARLTDQVHSLAMTAMGATNEQILEQKILTALNTTGGFAKQISELNQKVKDSTDEEEIGRLKAQQADLAKLALDFYDHCMSGEIRDPAAYARGLQYGERVAEAFSDLGALAEEFNYEPTTPTTQKIADPDSRLRHYILTETQKDRHEEIYDAQYNQYVNAAVNSAAYRNGTPREKAQILLDAKNDARDEAMQVFTEELRRSSASPEFDDKYASYSPLILNELVRLDTYQDHDRLSFMPTAQAQSEYVDPNDNRYKWVLDERAKDTYYQLYHIIYEDKMSQVMSSAKYQSLSDEQKAAWLNDTKDNSKTGVSTLARLNTIEWMKQNGYTATLRDVKAAY